MFEEEDALPLTELQPPGGDRDHLARAGQDAAEYVKYRRPYLPRYAPNRKYPPVRGAQKIPRDHAAGSVGVFRDDQAATCVSNEDSDGACSLPRSQ